MGSLPVTQINSVVVDPRDAKNVFAAGPSGLFRSNDSGLTWQPSGTGLPNVEIAALALNPSQPDRLYAATGDGVLFRSEDNGQRWQAVATVK